ncbi:MAG: hypothetical protein M1594_01680 [Candidatus Marsarchaeota archaeon]|nr:hypothetical protein [Candidatus Marsarchaeota archaeon]
MLISTLVLANSWSGYVVNSNTGVAVGNATISFDNGINIITNTSNGSGFFNVSFSNGTECVLTFSAVGYYNDSNQPYNYSSSRFCPSSGVYNNQSDVFFNPMFFNFTLTPLNPGVLNITVTDVKGNPLSNAVVNLTGQTQQVENSTLNGNTVFYNLTDPVYNYTVSLSNYSEAIGSASIAFNSTSNISIVLYPEFLSNFTGFVSSANGMVNGAVVNITDLNSYNTTFNGQFFIQNVYPGIHTVTVSNSGYISTTASVNIPPSSSTVYMFYLSQQPSAPPSPSPSPGNGGGYTYYGCAYNNPSCGSGMICVNNACVQPAPVVNKTTSNSNQTQNTSIQKPVSNAYILTQNYTVILTSGNSSYFIPISRTINVYALNNSFITKVSLSVFNNYSLILPDFYLREVIPSGLSNFTFYSMPSLMISSNEPEWLAFSLGSKSFFTVGYTFNYYTPSSNASLFTAPQLVAVQEFQSNFSNYSAVNATNSTENSNSTGGLTGFATAFKSPLILGAVAVLAVLIAVLAYLTLKPDESESAGDEEESKGLKNIVEEVGAGKSDAKPKTRKTKK